MNVPPCHSGVEPEMISLSCVSSAGATVPSYYRFAQVPVLCRVVDLLFQDVNLLRLLEQQVEDLIELVWYRTALCFKSGTDSSLNRLGET